MHKGESSKDCPLCMGSHWAEIGQTALAPIQKYWEQFNYKLATDFPHVPEYLTECRCSDCGLHFYQPSLIGSDHLYERSSTWDLYYNEYKWEFTEVLDWLSKRPLGKLLELGCGTGAFLVKAKRFCESAEGIEFNKRAVARCHELNLSVTDAPIENMAGTFDTIVAFQVFEHVALPGEIIAQCVTHLAPGGELIIAVPNHDGVLKGLNGNFLNLPPHHATHWEKSCFTFIAERHGLEIAHYKPEPISLELYQVYSQDQLRRLQTYTGLLGWASNKLLSLLHRAMLPYFFDAVRNDLHGHTQLAILRKPMHEVSL